MENIDIATALVLRGLDINEDTPKEILHGKVKYFQDKYQDLGFRFFRTHKGTVYSGDLVEWLVNNSHLLDNTLLDKYTVKPEIQKAFEEMSSLDTTIKVIYPDWILSL